MTLNHKGGGSHTENQTVAAAVKGQRSLLDHVVGGGCTGGSKATCNPFPQVVSRDIVTANDHDAVNATCIQPIFGYAKGGGCRRTSEVDGGVWPPNARVLRKLRVAHVEGLEEVSSVKAPLSVIAIGLGMLGGHLKAGETRREHNARALTLDLWNLPVSNQTQSTFPDLFNGRQRNTGVSEGQEAGRNSELRADVPSDDGFGVDAKFLGEIKGTFQARQLRHVTKHGGLVHVD